MMAQKKNKVQKQKTARTTVSMLHLDNERDELNSDSKEVSIDWVVRDAIEQYMRFENSSTASTKH